MIRADELAPVGPFPAGVTNTVADDQTPPGALRAAVNVELDKEGWPRRRHGRVNRVAATRAHSLHLTDEHLLALVDGDLCAYDDGLALAATVRADVGARFASFTNFPDGVFWSNGLQIRRIDPELGDHPVALDCPHAPTAAASATGGMAAGDYEVALTWRGDDGRQSGASAPVVVTVPAGGGVMLTNLPTSAEDAAMLEVYIAPPDQDVPVLYRAATVPAGTPALHVGAHQPGPALATLFHQPMPAGQIVRYGHGRLCVAAGNLLCWSEALRAGLMHQDNHTRFGKTITLLEPVGEGDAGSGFYVADHARTYFLASSGPATWQKSIRFAHPAVPGTSIVAPGNAFGLETTAPVAFWLAANGVFCLGLPGGQVQPLTDGRLALNVGERGAVAFREFDGLRQMITTFLVGGANAMGVADSAVATIRRNGVVVSA